MSAALPQFEPATIVAGDTVEWTRNFPGYTPADGYALSYAFNKEGTVAVIDATGDVPAIVPSGTGWAVTVSGAITGEWTPGKYVWAAYVTRDGKRTRVALGTLRVDADPAKPGQDPRSYNRITLDNIRAIMQGRGNADAMRYTIGGRELQRIPYAELKAFESDFAWRVANEEGRASRTLKARFLKERGGPGAPLQ